MPAASVDVLLVSLGSTAGLRAADEELLGSLRRAGSSAAMVRAARPREIRTLALTDLGWARAARAATRSGLERARPRAVIYSTTTASLLWPAPGAIRFDAPSSGNRPGRHGVWQRPVEARRLQDAPLLLPWSDGALGEAPSRRAPGLVLPVPVESSLPTRSRTAPAASLDADRDIAAITYGANPHKKGLDRVLEAWSGARRQGESLVVAGLDAEAARRHLGAALAATVGVSFVGALDRDAYRALVRRARVFVTAPRREDYGIAQLEALADGCVLVTNHAPGPYAALPVARRLDPRLVGNDIAAALRIALDEPRPGYRERAVVELRPWSREHVDQLVADELLPALLASGSAGRA